MAEFNKVGGDDSEQNEEYEVEKIVSHKEPESSHPLSGRKRIRSCQ